MSSPAAPRRDHPSLPTLPGSHESTKRAALVLGAIGVVFGDIGTSPLYALKECFSPENPHHVAATPGNVLGVLSLVFWAMMMVIVVKYTTFIMRADNEGQGGILALLALIPQKAGAAGPGFLLMLALFGTALLYGDGVITPAISVLSAMEGLEIATTKLKPVVLPATILVLLALFVVQKRGTGGIGKVFGPTTLLWFAMIAVLGGRELVQHPQVLFAIDPRNAISFFATNHFHGFLVLGSVFLVVTGGEALYADMGHFGRGPIRIGWYGVVFPSLLLNYFGQGALLLRSPEAATNPFYGLVPGWALIPVVVVATAATVVASQALISGAFSLTQQAVQLGYFPRVTVVHTSKSEAGQIYVPEINTALLVACIGCVLLFKSSTALAAAYGIAVTGTMAITTVVYYVVVTRAWGWSPVKAGLLAGVFLVFDIAFFVANAAKFMDGGWFPVTAAVTIFAVMTTWKRGRRELAEKFKQSMLPLDAFIADLEMTKPPRVRGTAVFMASSAQGTPPALLHHFKHNQVLHEQLVLLTVESAPVPEVPADRRIALKDMGHGIVHVTMRYGFMENPDVPRALSTCPGLTIEPARTSYYVGRETLLSSGTSKMARWRKWLFAFISRNARPATAYFGLPPGRVVELGMQIDL
ncbi:MAG: potassium transporter Kup [Deltaproteobacteria bacterium]|nr:potassium transporter Kup [Deltaproteobacteria bacterium]